jgi:hypothetical protein
MLKKSVGLSRAQASVLSIAAGGTDTSTQKPDPVLEHLLRTRKSKHIRKHFFANPAKEYTEQHDVRILVRFSLP